jgi:menaquinone-dependent protoporphyrinogen oxidase
MARLLLLYASTHGHTKKIATRIAETLAAEGAQVDVRDARSDPPAELHDYGAFIAAASLHQAKHQPEMVDWVRAHLGQLEELPSLFISVSLTAAENTPEANEATKRCIDEFAEETGWRPDRSVPVAGALQYLEYDIFTRTLMRLMMKRGGHPTDVSHDYDYTDWDGLEQLARDFKRRWDEAA